MNYDKGTGDVYANELNKFTLIDSVDSYICIWHNTSFFVDLSLMIMMIAEQNRTE